MSERPKPRRRALLVGGAAALASACRPRSGSAPATNRQTHEWRMVTAWPKGFPIFGTSAERLARRLEAASDGQIRIQVFGAGELVPAFEAFDAVSRGVAQVAHSSPAYWRGPLPASQLFTGVPFGMTASQLNAWLHFGDGLTLWRKACEPFGIVPFPVGNTGVQMGGWFHRPIERMADLEGLKIRIVGLGAEVLERVGATPVAIPGAEVFTALETGAIDATEFTGPANDLAFGFHQVARYYHYPGWHEPAGTLECLVNQAAFAALSEPLKALVEAVCIAENDRTTAEFTARNQRALERIEALDSVELVAFPREVLLELRRVSREVLDEKAQADPVFGETWRSFSAFAEQSRRWQALTERAYLDVQGPD